MVRVIFTVRFPVYLKMAASGNGATLTILLRVLKSCTACLYSIQWLIVKTIKVVESDTIQDKTSVFLLVFCSIWLYWLFTDW